MTLAPASEVSTPPPGTAAPANVQPQQLVQLLDQADKMIWRDGGMDEDEKRVVISWFQMQTLKLQAKAAGGQQAAAPGAPGAPPPDMNREAPYGGNDGAQRPEDTFR